MSRSSTFIPHARPETVDIDDTVVNYDDFYPGLSLSEYRRKYRNDDTVTDERLKENMQTAFIFINNSLKAWRIAKKDLIQLSDEQKKLYCRAVYHRTKILTIEQYPDIDTTGKGNDKGDAMLGRIKHEQQREREAIRLMTARLRTTITLL